ncbi:MAG: hypothetical protein H7257_06805 [Taibaiella sp.]|nr:hypothetical protein [Taibaiella sp.]
MMKIINYYHRLGCLLLVACLFTGVVQQARGQSYIETFGQSRVQKRKFDWKFFDTKHFRVYHYDRAGRQLGRYVAEEAENNISVIEQKMGGQFPERFNIVLYNSYDEYMQTNIGLKDATQISENTISGTWNLVGDKLLVYHTGKHTDLRRQIQSGMARVVMERMIFGESFKKMAKTALLMNLPQWVTDGFIAYLVDGWNTEANSEWKRLLDARPKVGFHEFSEEYPEMAGKAFWKFIADNYGTEKMKNLLGDMQQRTSLNKSMKDKSNLGIKVTKAYDSCMVYFKKCYALDSLHQELPDSTKGLIALKVPKGSNVIIRDIKVSPRGSEIAYTAWKDGQYTVYLQKTAKDQTQTVLLEGGRKDLTQPADPDYPLMAWSAGGNKMAILYQVGEKTLLRVYNNQKTRIENYVIPPNRFDRVLGMCFMEDDANLLFSAIKKSQTDLYSFPIKKNAKLTNITDDAWDDIEPVFVSGGSRKGILFLSNRPKANMDVPLAVNELPTGPMNVFFYNTTTQRRELLQCSKITTGRITQPIQYGRDNFAYLYDGNGIENKYAVLFARDEKNMDTAYSVPVTNYNTSIISHQYNAAVDEVADVIQIKNKYMVYFHGLQMPTDSTPAKTLVPTTLSIIKEEKQAPNAAGVNVRYDHTVTQGPGGGTAIPEVQSGNAFQSEFSDTTAVRPRRKKHTNNPTTAAEARASGIEGADSSTLTVINDSAYLKMKPSPYRVSFKPDMFNVRVDNSILFSQYQPYGSTNGQYQNPGISALTTINMNELLENYKVTAGFQLPIDLASSAYFLQFRNNTRRLDWSVLGLRTQKKDYQYVVYTDQNGNPLFVKEQLFKNVTNMIQGDISYPLDKIRSLRFSTAVRQDRMIQKAQDTLSLSYDFPNATQYWSLSRGEYVFDNTISPILNIRKGTRYKVYAEYMYQANGNKQSCYNIGFDFRTYQKIYKNAIWATRVAYAHSDGTSKVQYQLGGVDNWVAPQVAKNNSAGGDYGFMALASSLRGYQQAARKGNNYAVFSTEVRLPVLTTFFKRPIQSAILKNLQAVAFVDAGSAWKGFLPSAENLSNTYNFPQLGQQLSNVAVSITVPNSSGLGIGYGGGLRTTMFGYFVRCDAAWNIDGLKKPIVYFAIGTDF